MTDLRQILQYLQFEDLTPSLKEKVNDFSQGEAFELGIEHLISNFNLTQIEIEVPQEIKAKSTWLILSLHDTSTGMANRVVATILIENQQYTRKALENIIDEIIQDIRNVKTGRIRGDKPTQVIWLFIAQDTDDVQMVNWICRVLWVDQRLAEWYRPIRLSNDKYEYET